MLENLSNFDSQIADSIKAELKRQQNVIELIPSENFVSPAVLEALGSVLTNKYAEGYPGNRYYGGTEHVDVTEQIAIDRAKQLFSAQHVNVQPLSGAPALLSVDGFIDVKLEEGDHVVVEASPHVARFLRAQPPSYHYTGLTQRLGLEPGDAPSRPVL